MSSKTATIASFIEAAPPGEVGHVASCWTGRTIDLRQVAKCGGRYYAPSSINSPHSSTHITTSDIKALTADEPQLLQQLGPTYQKYNEEQFVTVKLPGSSESVRIQWEVEAKRHEADGQEIGHREPVQLIRGRPIFRHR